MAYPCLESPGFTSSVERQEEDGGEGRRWLFVMQPTGSDASLSGPGGITSSRDDVTSLFLCMVEADGVDNGCHMVHGGSSREA